MVLYLFRERDRIKVGLKWLETRDRIQQTQDRADIIEALIKSLDGCFRDHSVLLIDERCTICFTPEPPTVVERIPF